MGKIGVKRANLMYLGGNWELSVDLRQWMLGFNSFKHKFRFVDDMTAVYTHSVNIFIGPLCFGWWAGAKEFWANNPVDKWVVQASEMIRREND